MDFAKVRIGPSVVSGQSDVAIPDGRLLKVAHAFLQRGAVRALDDLDIQANGGNLQRSQGPVAVIAVLGDAGEPHGSRVIGPGGNGEMLRGSRGTGRAAVQNGCAGQESAHAAGDPVLRHGVIRAAYLIHQPSAQGARDQIGPQILTGAGEVAGGRPEAGGHQGHVLAPVHVGVFLFVDRVIAGRPGEQEIVRPVIAVLEGAGLDGTQGADHAGQQEGSQFQSFFISFEFFCMQTRRPGPAPEPRRRS